MATLLTTWTRWSKKIQSIAVVSLYQPQKQLVLCVRCAPGRVRGASILITIKRCFCRIISSLHPEKTGEKRFYYKQDVSPSRASSAKQRTEWGGKELHTDTETTRHRCPGARYGKQVRGAPLPVYRTWHRGTDVSLSRYRYVTPSLPMHSVLCFAEEAREGETSCL